jgi:hypothetical protein
VADTELLVIRLLNSYDAAMFNSPSHHGLNPTRGYDREVPTKEWALFVVLLVLPFALLLVPALASL